MAFSGDPPGSKVKPQAEATEKKWKEMKEEAELIRAVQRDDDRRRVATPRRGAKIPRTQSGSTRDAPLVWTMDGRFKAAFREEDIKSYGAPRDAYWSLEGARNKPGAEKAIRETDANWTNPRDQRNSRMFVARPGNYNRKRRMIRVVQECIGMREHAPSAQKILFATLPYSRDIFDQILHFFMDPAKVLLVANYVHSHRGVLDAGRMVKPLPRDYGRDPNLRRLLEERYAIQFRMDSDVIDAHFALAQIEIYLRLVELITTVPRHTCALPLVVARGQSDFSPWDPVDHEHDDDIDLSFDAPQKYISTSIVSATLSTAQMMKFAAARDPILNDGEGGVTDARYYFIFHVARSVPRLWINDIESEVLLPPGTRWILRDTFKHELPKSVRFYFHIAVDMAPLEFS